MYTMLQSYMAQNMMYDRRYTFIGYRYYEGLQIEVYYKSGKTDDTRVSVSFHEYAEILQTHVWAAISYLDKEYGYCCKAELLPGCGT